MLLDNVLLQSVIPEPGAGLVWGGLGLTGIWQLRRRRQL
jgi:MYXO-CTERM domain-containing protein